MTKDDIEYHEAATRLKGIRDAISRYNEYAIRSGMYVIGIESGAFLDLRMAESGIPRNILEDVFQMTNNKNTL